MRISREILFDVIPRFLKDGWQVVSFHRARTDDPHLRLIDQNVHAIGDRANGIVLDAFESALEGANVTALRPRLEHAQIVSSHDMERLGRLGGAYIVYSAYRCTDGYPQSHCKYSTNSRVSVHGEAMGVPNTFLTLVSSSISDMSYAEDRLVRR
jgi:hypothetical protein